MKIDRETAVKQIIALIQDEGLTDLDIFALHRIIMSLSHPDAKKVARTIIGDNEKSPLFLSYKTVISLITMDTNNSLIKLENAINNYSVFIVDEENKNNIKIMKFTLENVFASCGKEYLGERIKYMARLPAEISTSVLMTNVSKLLGSRIF